MKKPLIIAVILIIAGAFGWYTISPLFIDEVVEEEFVFDKNIRAPQTQDEQKLPEKVFQEGETVTQTTKNGPVVNNASTTPIPAPEPPEPESTLPPAPTGPVVLADGTFKGSDAFHKGSGEAFVVQTEDGNILRFENFNVTNGPDLRVLLSTEANPTSRSNLGDYIEVEKLKGNIGNQNYQLPDSVDVSIYKSVVIYCDPFHIVFSSAPLN